MHKVKYFSGGWQAWKELYTHKQLASAFHTSPQVSKAKDTTQHVKRATRCQRYACCAPV